MAQVQSVTPGKVIVDATGVVVPAASLTTILEINVDDAAFMGLAVRPVTQAFDQFVVQARMTPDDTYQTILSVAADYTTPAGIVVDASGDLTILGAGASGWLLLNVLPFYSIRVQASAAVDSATVSARAIARG